MGARILVDVGDLHIPVVQQAVVDRISIKRQERAGLMRTVIVPGPVSNDIMAIVAGVVLYALFVWKLHAWLIGVSPV